MDENEAGVDAREKYRIRVYGPDSPVIHLEIKSKTHGLTHKDSCDLSRQEYEQILAGTLPLPHGDRPVLNRLGLQMRCAHMRPKAIIVYERTAFVHPVGNVRITFDRNITASRYIDGLFDARIPGLTPVMSTGQHVLEVKYDELLPDAIAGHLELGKLRQTAFSKYYLGRLALRGEWL